MKTKILLALGALILAAGCQKNDSGGGGGGAPAQTCTVPGTIPTPKGCLAVDMNRCGPNRGVDPSTGQCIDGTGPAVGGGNGYGPGYGGYQQPYYGGGYQQQPYYGGGYQQPYYGGYQQPYYGGGGYPYSGYPYGGYYMYYRTY